MEGAQKLEISFFKEIVLGFPVKKVYDWLTDFPACLHFFPLLKEIEMLEKGRAKAQVGPFGYRQFNVKSNFTCEMMITVPNKEVRIASIPGGGDSDVELIFILEPIAGGKETKVTFDLNIATHQVVPRMVPVKMILLAANRTIDAALRQGFKKLSSELARP